MITLTTGLPGSGKTLYTIDYVRNKAQKENREVYYHGIKDLMLPWVELDDATQWDCLPNGAIIVIDECQTIFRPRGAGSAVPPYIAAMETHRHKGYDIFLITQHPMLVDQNIRRLVGQHFHAVRKFGLERSSVHEWGSTHEITQRNLSAAVRHEYKFTPEVYALYKSAEQHTHKKRVPFRVYFLMASPLLIAALLWYGWQVLGKMHAPKGPDGSNIVQAAGGGQSRSGEKRTEKISYLEQYIPQVTGMPWTAAAYEQVTQPVDAPRPQTCLINHKANTCRCLDQQGNTLHVDKGFCESFVKHGMFIPWHKPEKQSEQTQAAAKGREAAPAMPLVGAVSSDV